MTNKKISILLLIFAIILSVLTRGYKLGEAPEGLYIDEAGQGYSAYSILKTGKDEFGMPWPAVFRSFTDFKTPVYVYTVVPFIPIFGLTPLSVRIPSFIASIGTIFILFVLLKEFCKKDSLIPGLTVLILSISPWHILFGRTNFECNLALFLLLSGVYSFLKGAAKPYLYTLSFIFLAFAFPAYHAQRIITPLMALFLMWTERKNWNTPNARKWIVIGIILGALISVPTIKVSLTPGFLARASGLNIFSQQKQKPAGFLTEAPEILAPIVNSPLFLSSQEFLALYTSYFSPRQMFWLGDFGPRSSFPNLSTHYLWQFPLYLYGLFLLLRGAVNHKLRNFILFFLAISPLPAAVTRDPYSTIRALQMVVPLSVVIAISIEKIITQKIFQKRQIVTWTMLIFVVCYSLLKLYSSVLILNEYYRGRDWDYGWKQVTETIKTLPDAPIIVDNSREEAYIELVFFLKYDPIIYQKDHPFNLDNYYTDMNHVTEKRIGNVVTRPINWETDIVTGNVLIGDELSISDNQIKEHNLEIIRDIHYKNTDLAFRIVRVK